MSWSKTGGAFAVAFAASVFATSGIASSPAGPSLYRFADGASVALVPAGDGLRLVDYRTGALRQLVEQSPDRYVAGPGVSVLTPSRIRLRLLHDGSLSEHGRVARRLAVAVRPAVFAGGGNVRLGGRLLEPSGKGPFPAVVIVPGSVRATRDTYDLWAMFFVSEGYAVLTYDKRGVGSSGGSYDAAATDANLRDLAADALGGVAWLRRQPELDTRRIGLSGGSQAGWVIALAASQSAAVRFAAIQSGPAMSVGRQLAYTAITHAGALDPPPTAAQVDAGLDGKPDSGFDPRPAIESLRIPVLWQLGAVDERVHVPESVANLEAIVAAGGHDFTVRVYPGGAHSLRVTAHGLISEEQSSPGFVAGLFSDLAAWLRGHVRVKAS